MKRIRLSPTLCSLPARLIGIIVLSLWFVGCHESGTWVDDARNWKRVFRAPRPNDVQLVRSWYWRSVHWTYEYEYYMQIQSNAAFQKHLLAMNPMVEQTTINASQAWSERKPGWFASKPLSEYRIWESTNTHSQFRLLIDRETGDLFLSDWQL